MRIYGRVMRTGGVGVLIASTTLTRVTYAINTLAVLLFVRETTGSFGTAGLVTGALALGAAIGAPLVARLVDRRGAGVLLPLACGHAAALLGLLALGEAGAPAVALALLAVAGGVCFPPSGSVLRAKLSHLLGGDPALVSGAYALDSVTIEVSFVAGPLLTALLAALAGPGWAIALGSALVVAGTVLFLARLPAEHRRAARERPASRLGALAAPGVRAIALGTVPLGFCIGAIEVALPAFTTGEGSAELGGVLLAVWSAASGFGGLAFGARRPGGELVDIYLRLALLFPLACLPLALAGSTAAMIGLVVLAGLPIAPMIASRNELVGVVAPGGSVTEAFTWLMTALIVGVALGNAAAGTIAESAGWAEAVLCGAAVGLAGGLVSLARRGSLAAPLPA